jgi:hypothetical protein
VHPERRAEARRRAEPARHVDSDSARRERFVGAVQRVERLRGSQARHDTVDVLGRQAAEPLCDLAEISKRGLRIALLQAKPGAGLEQRRQRALAPFSALRSG